MITKYFTDKTQVFEITNANKVYYNYEERDKTDALAAKLSKATNVPKTSIYTSSMNCRVNNWHKIDGIYYFFKSLRKDYEFINELLGEVISEYFDLDTVHYMISKVTYKNGDTEYGIASKNFCKSQYSYKTLDDYIASDENMKFFEDDLHILQTIRNICSTNQEFDKLQDDLKKLFIRHLYNTQRDGGNGQNIMIETTEDGKRLAPLYDYESAYVHYDQSHVYSWDVTGMDLSREKVQELFRNDPRFQELLYKLMNADIKHLIKQVEEKHQILIPEENKDHYYRYEQKVKSLVRENHLIV